MSKSKVIPFPKQPLGGIDALFFSSDDERLIISILAALCSEMAAPILGSEARMRLYFYLGLNRYGVQRWLGSYTDETRTENRGLCEQIDEAFQYLTSQSRLEDNVAYDPTYRTKVCALSSAMFSLLQRAHAQGSEC
jgi:hypothetical protein